MEFVLIRHLAVPAPMRMRHRTGSIGATLPPELALRLLLAPYSGGMKQIIDVVKLAVTLSRTSRYGIFKHLKRNKQDKDQLITFPHD